MESSKYSTPTNWNLILEQQPPLLTKKWLRVYFRISLNPQSAYDHLKLKVFTPEVLVALDLTETEYKQVKTFTALQSKVIRELFEIPPPYQSVIENGS